MLDGGIEVDGCFKYQFFCWFLSAGINEHQLAKARTNSFSQSEGSKLCHLTTQQLFIFQEIVNSSMNYFGYLLNCLLREDFIELSYRQIRLLFRFQRNGFSIFAIEKLEKHFYHFIFRRSYTVSIAKLTTNTKHKTTLYTIVRYLIAFLLCSTFDINYHYYGNIFDLIGNFCCTKKIQRKLCAQKTFFKRWADATIFVLNARTCAMPIFSLKNVQLSSIWCTTKWFTSLKRWENFLDPIGVVYFLGLFWTKVKCV